MKALAPLLLASTLAAGCVSSAPGEVRASGDNPLVTVGAGSIAVGGGNFWRVWYVVDRATQTCWIKLGDSGAAMDCCQLRLVEAAGQHIIWETDASCRGASAEPPPVPPAPPAPPAAPAPPTP